jgi:hydroxypyruvate isomerase
MNYRAEVIGTILAVQAKTQGVEAAERSIAAIADESFKNQVRGVMEETKVMKCEPIDLLSVSRRCVFVNDTFDTLYPEN